MACQASWVQDIVLGHHSRIQLGVPLHLVVNELLAAEARVDRHDQDQVCTAGALTGSVSSRCVCAQKHSQRLPYSTRGKQATGTKKYKRGSPTKLSTCSMADRGVAGFSTMPALHPRSLICSNAG